MKGSIAKRGKSYFIRVFLYRTREGKQRFLTKTVRGTRRQAEARLAELITEAERLRARQPAAADIDTLGTWLTTWLDSRRKAISTRTHRSYADAISKHIMPTIGTLPLRQVTGTVLTRFYGGIRYGDATVRRCHAILHTSLRQAVRDGLVLDNAADHAELPRRKRAPEVQVPTHADIARVIEANSGRWESVAILLMLATGLRRGEVLGLRWSDIQGDVLHVKRAVSAAGSSIEVAEPKTASGIRQVRLPPTLLEELRRYRIRQREDHMQRGIRSGDDIVFPASPGGIMVPTTFSSAIAYAGRKVGVRLNPHALRHRFATDALAGGIDVRIVQQRLGHAKADITRSTYQHVIEDMQATATDVAEDILGKVLR